MEKNKKDKNIDKSLLNSNMINSNFIKKIIVVILLLLISIFLINLTNKLNKTSELYQLSATSSRQMMGYLIKTNNNKIIAIDGGMKEDSEEFINKVKELGANKIDYWFLTHPHIDHCGVFSKIVDEGLIEIDKIYYSFLEEKWYEEAEPDRKEETNAIFNSIRNDRIKSKLIEVNKGETIEVGNLKIKVLEVKNPEFTQSEYMINNQSMIFKIIGKRNTVLILGDCGIQESNKLLKDYTQEELKADICQIAHHGQAGATKDLYKAINPKVCLWPTTEWIWNNTNGNLKTEETRKWIEELNVEQNILAFEGIQQVEI